MRISVALCTFNGARFVAEQVRSILEQSPAPDQLVVADDGSDDGTVEVVRRIADGRAIVLDGDHAAPLGVTANFERALAATDGDIVALSDQDDVWHGGRLAALAERFAADPGLTLVHTDADLIDDAGAPLGRTLFDSLEVQPHELAAERSGRAFDAFLRRNLATGATVVLRRSLLELARPFPESWVHDEWLAIVAAAVGRVDVVSSATIDYRIHAGNQIGVAEPTFVRKLQRVLEPRADRNRQLSVRFRTLVERLEALGDAVPAEYLQAARAKSQFETRRAGFPPGRLRRAVPVLRLAVTGRYGRFASRGRADILRDLLQPA